MNADTTPIIDYDFPSSVMEQIHSRHISMRPRAYFLAGSLLLGGGLAASSFTGGFFLNVAFFHLRFHEPFGYLWFGQFGLHPFLSTFPWIPFGIATVGMSCGFLLLRSCDFSYKLRFLHLAAVFTGAILTLGFLLDVSGINEHARRTSHLRLLYPHQFVGDDWVIGEITSIRDHALDIQTPLGAPIRVTWDAATLLPWGGDFNQGERIRIVGHWDDVVFSARGIGKRALHE